MVEELLDQEGLEVDPVDRMEKETPLHKAVKYANTTDAEGGEMIVELLLEAGADPRYFLLFFSAISLFSLICLHSCIYIWYQTNPLPICIQDRKQRPPTPCRPCRPKKQTA